MPDLISHTASAYILNNLWTKWGKHQIAFPMLLLGVFLPDILSRAAIFLGPEIYLTAQFFHTPLACFFQSTIISSCFIKDQQWLVLKALTLGWVLHQSFDLLQTSLDPLVYTVYWPFSARCVSIGPIWIGHWYYVAGITIFLAIITQQRILKKFKTAFTLIRIK